jgi:hypothetical protein
VVLTEPLWGIPYSLYAPYASVYMLALGLRDSQIGLVASINMGLQVFWSLMSGAITDKLGRKRTTFIFDFIAWSVPCVIWAVSQNFTYFVVAAVINSSWRVTHTSWTCTLVEDTDPELLVDIYTWIYIAGLLSAFFAPLAGVLIAGFSLIPTVRGLYVFAAIMMTAKFVIMNLMVEETQRGKIRMQETRDHAGDEHFRQCKQQLLGSFCHPKAADPGTASRDLSFRPFYCAVDLLFLFHPVHPRFEFPQSHPDRAGRFHRQPDDPGHRARGQLYAAGGQRNPGSLFSGGGQHPGRPHVCDQCRSSGTSADYGHCHGDCCSADIAFWFYCRENVRSKPDPAVCI